MTKLQDVSDEDDEERDEVVAALGRGDCTIDEELGCTEHPYGHCAEIDYEKLESSSAPSEFSETEAEFTPREGASADLGQVNAITADDGHDGDNDNGGQEEEEEEEGLAIEQVEQQAGSGDAAAADPQAPARPITIAEWEDLSSSEPDMPLSPRTRRQSTRFPLPYVAPHPPAAGGAAENDSKPARLQLFRSGSISDDSDLVYMGVKARPSPEV